MPVSSAFVMTQGWQSRASRVLLLLTAMLTLAAMMRVATHVLSM
jgi:hypothetical protein